MKEEKNDKKQVEISKDEDTKNINKDKTLIDGIKNLIANEINDISLNALNALVTVMIYRISYLRHWTYNMDILPQLYLQLQ